MKRNRSTRNLERAKSSLLGRGKSSDLDFRFRHLSKAYGHLVPLFDFLFPEGSSSLSVMNHHWKHFLLRYVQFELLCFNMRTSFRHVFFMYAPKNMLRERMPEPLLFYPPNRRAWPWLDRKAPESDTPSILPGKFLDQCRLDATFCFWCKATTDEQKHSQCLQDGYRLQYPGSEGVSILDEILDENPDGIPFEPFLFSHTDKTPESFAGNGPKFAARVFWEYIYDCFDGDYRVTRRFVLGYVEVRIIPTLPIEIEGDLTLPPTRKYISQWTRRAFVKLTPRTLEQRYYDALYRSVRFHKQRVFGEVDR